MWRLPGSAPPVRPDTRRSVPPTAAARESAVPPEPAPAGWPVARIRAAYRPASASRIKRLSDFVCISFCFSKSLRVSISGLLHLTPERHPRVLPDPALLFARSRGKVFQHLLHALVQVLDALVRLVGERVARRSTPQQFLGLRIERVEHQGAYFVVVDVRGCAAATESAAPAPAASKAVVEGVESLLVLCGLNGDQREAAARRNLRKAFRR